MKFIVEAHATSVFEAEIEAEDEEQAREFAETYNPTHPIWNERDDAYSFRIMYIDEDIDNKE